MRTVVVATAAMASNLVVLAAQVEQSTIPESLAHSGRPLVHMSSVPSGLPPTMHTILAQTDMIVRGVVGNPIFYLSKDERDLWSDYPIIKPAILADRGVVSTQAPGLPQVTVTILGGRYANATGLTFKDEPDALPRLDPGTEGLFLLKRIGDKLHVAGTFFGAFQITNGRIHPLVRKHGFAREYAGVLASAAVEEWRTIVSRRP